MPARTYGYYDPLAQALDVAGERWAILIVRELMSGATRYGDIAARLPGLGTARLADRLKEMQDAGLVEQSDGYRLTVEGLALGPAVYTLTRFGLRRLRPIAGTAVVFRPSFGAFALRACADAVCWTRERFSSLTIVEDQAFILSASKSGVTTEAAGIDAAHRAQLTVALDTVSALALATRQQTVHATLTAAELTTTAPARVLRSWAEAHGLIYQRK
ncbi:MAG: helix-turn-helix transcriptional regulator [Solirubrobacterales bacterium]|nr:helix-turn-helix transcriptional regulator [Solirubrobacterales bacterium]